MPITPGDAVNNDNPTSDISAVILAGGLARRMGGQDKGLIRFHGVPMVERISKGLGPQCSRIMVNANRNLDLYRNSGFDVFADELADYQGPLSGMHTALGRIDTQWLITAPCDGPFVDEHYVSEMHKKAVDEGNLLAVAKADERLQPVYALIHHSLRDSLGQFLSTGERKIDRWYHQVGFSEVDFGANSDMFVNINTPEQLADLERLHPNMDPKKAS